MSLEPCVLSLGSLNLDLEVRIERWPGPGESLPAPGTGPAFTFGNALQPSGSVLSALKGNFAPGGDPPHRAARGRGRGGGGRGRGRRKGGGRGGAAMTVRLLQLSDPHFGTER